MALIPTRFSVSPSPPIRARPLPSTTTACEAGEQTVFDANTSSDTDGTAARFDWDFGDGQTANDACLIPSHIYGSAGTFTVTLTVTDNEGCSTTVVYTGQTASCNGSAAARTTQQVTVADTPPEPKLSGKKSQKLGKSVKVEVTGDQACTAEGSGKLVVEAKKSGKAALKGKKFKLTKASKDLAANQKGTLKLKLPKKAQKAAKSSLKGKGKVSAKLTVAASDDAGNQTEAKRTVKLVK